MTGRVGVDEREGVALIRQALLAGLGDMLGEPAYEEARAALSALAAELVSLRKEHEATEHNRHHAHANLDFCIQEREALRAELVSLKDALEDAGETLQRIADGSEYVWGNIARLGLERVAAAREALGRQAQQ